MITRRSLFRGLGAGLALIAAPAIVRASSLMPVSVPRRLTLQEIADAMLRRRTAALADNVTRNNAALIELLERRIIQGERSFLAIWRPRIAAMYERGTGDGRGGLNDLLAGA